MGEASRNGLPRSWQFTNKRLHSINITPTFSTPQAAAGFVDQLLRWEEL